MKILNLSLLYILFESAMFAQSGLVTGNVIDIVNNSPLPYGTVTLNKQSDSTLLTGAITDSIGQFNLSPIPNGDYYLSLKFIGYNEQKVSGITIVNDNTVKFDNLKLTLDNELDAITVQGAKALFENKIDKKIFNAAESLEGQGGTGIDMLKAVPLITVDQNDNIFLRGDGNVTIFINGRPLAMPASEYLKQIPGSSTNSRTPQ